MRHQTLYGRSEHGYAEARIVHQADGDSFAFPAAPLHEPGHRIFQRPIKKLDICREYGETFW
jgi:hypothetical protein